MKSQLKIAIDGPAASGKSTTARMVASKLRYLYIDTGAMYRAITLAAIEAGTDIHDEMALVSLAEESSIDLQVENDEVTTFLNGKNVSELIRLPKVTKVISMISAHKGLREKMVEKQRMLARQGGVVMEGRDIGTHVLPDAEIKVFMTAGLKERALRRYSELKKKGIESSLEEIQADIARRDDLDSSRATAPLKPAVDAIHMDTSNMSIKEQVDWVLDLVDKFNQTPH